ncbi:2-oxo-4-hydroxy-4-carboxy-5-ureidoimidazoline decarboxylase [Krasilnikoviella flava]|uniref:2-oxo-4-hydroxy-4-carboxy-5-ureidoimidazoline decarboxylase n=1 Tax=Krasilnikoviella flava TaxID=526729 RepID=A0A1T5KN62_9MICO|nr:2-oxo-4-hydroxy-4-carboxy-5-ureidoimidazoline decarboxylase [Krasilnikoviella flava]SKC65137.1 2-oxo-4-hydroxy-4-carboxy-5-ureidoimidazoline decarboxylase [Krasilnikoviella flava]
MMSAGLEAFNTADSPSAREQVLSCAAVARWADAVVAGRPYPDVDAALAAARTVADPWSEEEIDSALARHPRIGERAEGADADAAHSRREQSGLGELSGSVEERLRAGNRAYEERFGHVFLIRAAGRTADEILAQLEVRLANDPAAERRIAGQQLREIAVLRLEGELA